MKLKKSDFKKLIKECLFEILSEDVQLMKGLVNEVINERLTKKQQSQQSPQKAKPQQMDERLRQREQLLQQRRSQSGIPQKRSLPQPKKDVWDIIAEDTMATTLREQVASERKLDRSNWASMITSEDNLDDSPLKHLKNAAMVGQQRYVESSQPSMMGQQYMQQELYQDPQSLKTALMSDDMAPSPAQLMQQFGGQGGHKQPPRVDTSLPADLAALGLGDKRWDVDEPPRSQHVAPMGTYNDELSRIAAEMNGDY